MYLKSLEIQGFKSFPDKTVLQFGSDITAIVGPNGSGKSNISDAISWVMGEQSSKALRGANMQDVIFNGTDFQKPMGMAEVSMTFDNSDSRLPVDFSEVQVSRRIYRSGESEYMINKAPCRLRDIHELFMDTGIGTSAYSMIGQGKMDMVASKLDAALNELTDITMAAGSPIAQGRKETGRAHAGARASTATTAHYNERKRTRSQHFAGDRRRRRKMGPKHDS